MNVRFQVAMFVAFPCAFLIGAAALADERPNLLLILADDVGREVLGCYGGASYATPRLDRLAATGTRFTHAYSMAVCHPTRTTLLSGQYPFRMGRPAWGSYPRQAEKATLANALRRAGYATAVAGKWQIGMLQDDLEQPHRMGFEDYCLFGWHEGPRYYQPRIWQNGQLRDDVDERYGPDVYCDFLIDFMSRRQRTPFLAFYSMALCHDVTDDLDQPVPFGPNGRYDSYAEMVAAMDERVGRIVDHVDQLGLGANTLIVYIADNGTPRESISTVRKGEFVSEPNVSLLNGTPIPGGKAELTDWGTRVPMIVRWPAAIPAPAVNDALIDVSDFLPTFVELADAEAPTGVALDGVSFANLLRGGKLDARNRRTAFAEHKGAWFVKERRWKLTDDERFFDTENDPNEKRPLEKAELAPDAREALLRLQRVQDKLRSAGASQTKDEGSDASD